MKPEVSRSWIGRLSRLDVMMLTLFGVLAVGAMAVASGEVSFAVRDKPIAHSWPVNCEAGAHFCEETGVHWAMVDWHPVAEIPRDWNIEWDVRVAFDRMSGADGIADGIAIGRSQLK